MKTTGELIAHFRHLKGLKQQTLADILHISQSTMSDIENDKHELKISELQSLAKTLEVPVTKLLPQDDNLGVTNFYQDHATHNGNNIVHFYAGIIEDIRTAYKETLAAKEALILMYEKYLNKDI